MQGEQAGDVGTDVADAQAEEDAGQTALLGLLHLRHDLARDRTTDHDRVARVVILGHRLVGAAGRDAGELVDRQAVVVIRHIAQEPLLHHAADDLVAQSVDVHGTAAAPVEQALGGLRRAVDRDAAVGDLALLADDGAAAARADGRHLEVHGVGRAQLGHVPHDLGNHVARLVDDDGVAHAHVAAAHLVDVVQRGARDGGARDHDGVELGDRRQHARAAHLDADLAQHGALFFRRELEGDGPARRTGGCAQRVLAGQRVDLHDDSVDIVVEVLAVREGAGAVVVHLGGGQAAARVLVDGETAGAQPVEELRLGRHVERVLVSDGVDKGREVAVGRDGRVLLPQAAGGGVARVGEGLLARRVGVLVEADEGVLGHVHLAADLHGLPEAAVDDVGEARLREGARHVFDGEHVCRDVLARGAVAARGRADQLAVTVREGHAEAVDLELAGEGDGARVAAAQRLGRAGQPLVELAQVHRVVDRVHAAGVRDRRELPVHIAADALGVGVGGDQLGIVALDALQLYQVAVELRVGQLGPVEGVVLVGRAVEDPAQLGRPTGCPLERGQSRSKAIRRGRVALRHQLPLPVESEKRTLSLCLSHAFSLVVSPIKGTATLPLPRHSPRNSVGALGPCLR